MLGKLIKKIRTSKGFTQAEIAKSAHISQSNYSKFEVDAIEIRATSFMMILDKVGLDLEEFEFIKNGYSYSDKRKLLIKFFYAPYNSNLKLKEIYNECELILNSRYDEDIKDIRTLCSALIHLNNDNDIEQARIPAFEIWDRLKKMEQLYISDIYLFNAIMFIFPLETIMETRNFIQKSIDRYKDFQNIDRMSINIILNLSYLYISNKKYSEALTEILNIEPKCKQLNAYIPLAICYIRKGICMERTGSEEQGKQWIKKGLNIVEVLEEEKLLEALKLELTL
ncbi:helix-turn-helix transcriptional regulator [Psychrobacillus sp. FSL K6-2843]|uniref:helix-turn-helix domain-containing protein n=1 Tax=Psychrobacillus sp. FSL K6-2843 TaxID=2921549 RepID=UPI00315AC167